VPAEEQLLLVIELIGTEALKTSEIEGEILVRDSVQSSLRRQFGLEADAQRAGQPSLTALSLLIQRLRTEYYTQLERANKTLDVEPWLDWFANLVLATQEHTLHGLDFLVANTRLWDRLRGQLNPGQEKALSRLMRAGIDGFVGGLSVGKYMALTGAPAAAARRDFDHPVELGALRRTGQLNGMRYWLPHQLPRPGAANNSASLTES